MSTRPFGTSRIPVSELGFGLPYGHDQNFTIEQSALDAVVRTDISLIDCGNIACSAAARSSKQVLNRIESLSKARQKTRLCASVGGNSFAANQSISTFEFSYDGVMRAYAMHCRQIGVNQLDMLFIDGLGATTNGELHESVVFPVAMQSGYRALEELRRSGDVQAIGLASQDIELCIAALDYGDWDGFLLNHRYSLLETWPLNTLLPLCENRQVSILLGEPFNSGILRGSSSWNYKQAPDFVVARVRNLENVCQQHNVPLAAAALQFPLAHPQVASVLPVMNTVRLVEQIIRWWNTDIPTSLWADLKLAGLLPDEAPVPHSPAAQNRGAYNRPPGEQRENYNAPPNLQ